MIPDCAGRSDRRSDGRTDGQTESIIAKTVLCIASYADALSKSVNIRYRYPLEHYEKYLCILTFDILVAYVICFGASGYEV